MLESYQQEVKRKRQSARIFWLIVFVCSLFLYFFFQGYYPDIRVGMRRIFMEPGNNNFTGSTDIMRSFGIINVRTTQLDANITLGSGSYANNEKRMSDYGNYTMDIQKSGYISNHLEFTIDREKPYFIEKVSLFPRPEYKKFNSIEDIFPMKNGGVLMRTASGIIFSGSTFSGKLVYTAPLKFIGDKYFSTETGVLIWENNSFENGDLSIKNFVQTCKNVEWKYDLFYCPKTKSLLTEGGKYMTGIIDIRDSLIERSGSVIQIVSGNIGKSWTLTGDINLRKINIIDDILYLNNSGSLIPKDKTKQIIRTPLENILHISKLKDDMVFIGSKGGELRLLIWRAGEPIERIQNIKFPGHLSYSNIEFHSIEGNIIIKTARGIILIYRGSNDIHWIVEGDILSYSDTNALYKKDNEFWSVDWSEKL
ncbi:hypothetical protein HOO68_02385 [Candidatus Gracilibacteria bacterium]|nr:hypothetical protein [Candidatus Gracilibacteria bacterium]